MVKHSRKRFRTKKRKNYTHKRYTKKVYSKYSKRRKYSKKRKNTKRKQRGGSFRAQTPKRSGRKKPLPPDRRPLGGAAGRSTKMADSRKSHVGPAMDLRPGMTSFGRAVSPQIPRGERSEPGGQPYELFSDVQGAATHIDRVPNAMDMDPTRFTTGLGGVSGQRNAESSVEMTSPTLGGVSEKRNMQSFKEVNPSDGTRRHFEGSGAQSTEDYDPSGTGMRHFEGGLHARTDTLGQQTSMGLKPMEPVRMDTGGAAGSPSSPLYSGRKAVTPRSAFKGAAGSDPIGYDRALNASPSMRDVIEVRDTVGEESAHARGAGGWTDKTGAASGAGLKQDTGMNLGLSGNLAYNFLVNQVGMDPQVVISQSKNATGHGKIIKNIQDTEGGSHVLDEMARYSFEPLGRLADDRSRFDDYDWEKMKQERAKEHQESMARKKDWRQFQLDTRDITEKEGKRRDRELAEETMKLQIKQILVASGSAENEDDAQDKIFNYKRRRPGEIYGNVLKEMLEGVKSKYPEATQEVLPDDK